MAIPAGQSILSEDVVRIERPSRPVPTSMYDQELITLLRNAPPGIMSRARQILELAVESMRRECQRVTHPVPVPLTPAPQYYAGFTTRARVHCNPKLLLLNEVQQ